MLQEMSGRKRGPVRAVPVMHPETSFLEATMCSPQTDTPLEPIDMCD